MSRYLGIKGLNLEIGGISYEFHFHEKHFWATKYNQYNQSTIRYSLHCSRSRSFQANGEFHPSVTAEYPATLKSLLEKGWLRGTQ